MFRRTQLQQTETIDMLRAENLKKYTEIYTKDGERIGVALRFVHRPIEDVNEALRLYRTYLVACTERQLLGVPVPTAYLGNYDSIGNRLNLSADLDTLEDETWNREPNFVARGLGVYEELPE